VRYEINTARREKPLPHKAGLCPWLDNHSPIPHPNPHLATLPQYGLGGTEQVIAKTGNQPDRQKTKKKIKKKTKKFQCEIA